MSLQGEGKLTGTESFFIRTSGCNLRCWFCDTPYASWDPSGSRQTVSDLVAAVKRSGLRHVVLTGGEPLLAPHVEVLCQELWAADRHLTIETAGTIDKPIACDLLSLSPKLADSAPDAARHPRWHRLHEQRRLPLKTMGRLIAAARDFQIKFVVSEPQQVDEIRSIAAALAVAPDAIHLMPQGTTVEALDEAQRWVRPRAEQEGYRYCDRMQIRWFGNRRGT